MLRFTAGFLAGLLIGHPILSKAYRSLPIRDRIILAAYNRTADILEFLNAKLDQVEEQESK